MLATLGLLFSLSIKAQSIELEYDQLTKTWLELSEEIRPYRGLKLYCDEPLYQDFTIDVLHRLHHYDSVLLDVLEDPTIELSVSHREYKRTLRDIEKFETKYGLKEFVSILNETCEAQTELEANKDDLKSDSGMYSYDGQILVMENVLHKYLKHIDKRVVAIDEHLHMIHPDRIMPFKALVMNK